MSGFRVFRCRRGRCRRCVSHCGLFPLRLRRDGCAPGVVIVFGRLPEISRDVVNLVGAEKPASASRFLRTIAVPADRVIEIGHVTLPAAAKAFDNAARFLEDFPEELERVVVCRRKNSCAVAMKALVRAREFKQESKWHDVAERCLRRIVDSS